VLNVPVQIVAAGVTVSGAIGAAYLVHLFSRRRDRVTRRATACANFRTTVIAAVSGIPSAGAYWGNQVLSTLPAICTTIGVAVGEFRPFLAETDSMRFRAEWEALKQHCEETIPEALSSARLMYGGGSPAAREAKEKFHAYVQNLLSFAMQT
jgi:hypothetical protein